MPLSCDDCAEGTFDDAQFTAVAAVHVYEGRFIPVNADDGFDLADLLCQATPASVAAVVINVEQSIADAGIYQRQFPLSVD